MRKEMIGSCALYFLITSIAVTLVSCNSPPKISAAKHGHRLVKAGTDVKLLCPVDDEADTMFEWKKGDEPINHGWERFRITQKGLKIRSVIVEDSGKYLCAAVNGFGEDKIYITLVVIDDSNDPDNAISNGVGKRPKFDDLEKMMRKSNFVRPVGSSLRFKCKASGEPQPKVIWVKDDEVIQEAELQNNHKAHYTLKLTNIQPSHSGEYTCYVHNRVGSINYTYTLEVIEKINKKPEILPPHPTNMTVAYGSTASFQCRVTSMVPPHMKWLKKIDPHMRPKPNNTFHLNGHELMVLKSDKALNIGKNAYLSKLVIHRVTAHDSGMYICLCLGANSVGINHKAAFLTVSPSRAGPLSPDGRSNDHDTKTPLDAVDESTTSSSLILEIAIPTIAFLVIVALLIYFFLHRRKRCSDANKRPPSTASSQNIQRVPLPAPEKDAPAQHLYHAPREKFSTMVYSKPCNSTDIYSDISSVSQSRYSPHGHNNGTPHQHAYTHLMQTPSHPHYQQQVHYNF